jgi:hypothetical protein
MKAKSLVVGSLSVFALILVVTGVSTGQSGSSLSADEQARVRIGFQIAPVPLNLHKKDPDLVGLGSYIVNTQAACNECHTQPSYAEGHDPYLGQPAKVNAAVYLAGGQPFGPFISRNITPDAKSHLPANLTFSQFVDVMRSGVDPEKLHPLISPLLQVMPWPAYGHMSNHDLAAIYEYLRSIPHADNPNAPAGD